MIVSRSNVRSADCCLCFSLFLVEVEEISVIYSNPPIQLYSKLSPLPVVIWDKVTSHSASFSTYLSSMTSVLNWTLSTIPYQAATS